MQSSFVMTEPDGCGSDPSMTYTRAERRGNDRWVVHGRKHYITGAADAKHFILIARTSDDDRRGLSAFLFHADQPGWRIVRRILLALATEGEAELRGRELDRLIGSLEQAGQATLRGVLCSGGPEWRFSQAPQRRLAR